MKLLSIDTIIAMIELISKYLVVYQDDQQIQLLRGSFLGLAVHVEVAKRNELRDC